MIELNCKVQGFLQGKLELQKKTVNARSLTNALIEHRLDEIELQATVKSQKEIDEPIAFLQESRVCLVNTAYKRVTTLEYSNHDRSITYYRRDGNTTRLIDNAIQILFSGNICAVIDHYENGRNRKANEYLFDRILKRISLEHEYIIAQRLIEIDRNKLEIRLLDKPMTK